MSIIIDLILAILAWVGVPAVDNGPCPTPFVEPTMVHGDDYTNGRYIHADGAVYAIAPWEDTCVLTINP